MTQPTDNAIEYALIAVLRGKPFEKITVDDIATGAGIDRSTFYRYFHSKYEALRAALPLLLTTDLFTRLNTLTGTARLEFITAWVTDNRRLMRNLLIENQQFSSYQELVRVVSKIMSDINRAVPADQAVPPLSRVIREAPNSERLIHFAAAIVVSVMTDYIANDDKVQAADVVTDVNYLFSKLGFDKGAYLAPARTATALSERGTGTDV